jgi:hypothetical protein
MFLQSVMAAKHVEKQWQVGENHSWQSYDSAIPPYFFLVPEPNNVKSRFAMDLYIARDTTPYDVVDGNSYPLEISECPMEDYFTMIVNDADGTCGAKSPSGYQTYNQRAQGAGRKVAVRNVTWNEVNPDGQSKVFSYFSVRMTNGMIYRTDGNCNTEFERLKYNADHTEYINATGETETEPNGGRYCFFLLFPEVQLNDGTDIGPYFTKISDDDEDSKNYVKEGFVPYLPVDPSIFSEINNNEGEIEFQSGRYMIPMKLGQMILPHNGLNLLFNRYQVIRPYHQDRREKKVTKSSGFLGIIAGLLVAVVSFFTFGLGLIVSAALGAGTYFLLQDPASEQTFRGTGGGKKTKPFGQEKWGPTYMWLQPESGTVREIPPRFVLMETESEDSILEQVASGSGSLNVSVLASDGTSSSATITLNGDPNHLPFGAPATNVVIDALTGPNDPTKPMIADPNMRLFQFMCKSEYNMNANGVTTAGFDSGAGVDIPITDPQVAGAYARYGPLLTSLDQLWAAEGYTDSPTGNPDDDVKTKLEAQKTNTSASMTVGGKTFPCSPAYKAVVDALNGHAAEIDEVDAMAAGTGGGPVGWDEMLKFTTRTEEGRRLTRYTNEIESAMYSMEPHYSKEWFEDTHEYSNVKTESNNVLITCSSYNGTWNGSTYVGEDSSGMASCLGNADTFMNQYNLIDTDDRVAGPFRYYTTRVDEGKRSLYLLGLWGNSPNVSGGTTFKDHVNSPCSTTALSFYRCVNNEVAGVDSVAVDSKLKDLGTRYE